MLRRASVHAAREIIDVPVFGGFKPAVHAAMGMADRIGILSILPDVAPACAGESVHTGCGTELLTSG